MSAAVQPNALGNVGSERTRRSKLVCTQAPQAMATEDRSLTDEDRAPRREDLPLSPDIALAYRVNDAIKVSGLSRTSIYKLIGEGKLRSVLVAGRRLIPADALRSLLGAA
jgi:hypothetical protein